MTDLLIPADAEAALVAELNDGMPTLGYAGPWGTRIPLTRPREFGRVVAVGGAGRNLVTDSPTATIEAFADTETRAQRMCAHAVAVVQRAARAGVLGSTTCYAARVVSLPSNLPMPSVPDRFRFTATVSLDLRRTAV